MLVGKFSIQYNKLHLSRKLAIEEHPALNDRPINYANDSIQIISHKTFSRMYEKEKKRNTWVVMIQKLNCQTKSFPINIYRWLKVSFAPAARPTARWNFFAPRYFSMRIDLSQNTHFNATSYHSTAENFTKQIYQISHINMLKLHKSNPKTVKRESLRFLIADHFCDVL